MLQGNRYDFRQKRVIRVPMRLRSSGIMKSRKRPRTLRARGGGTPGGSLESSRLAARWLNSRALALLLLRLTRRDGAQRAGGDGHHRSLLLFSRQVLHELAVGFL